MVKIPEGTRSTDGNMKDFKMGVFILAKKLQLPIQLVIIEGTRFALPKYSVNFHGKHPIKVRVLNEIPYKDFAHLSEEETAKNVWDYMNGELKLLQAEMASYNSVKMFETTNGRWPQRHGDTEESG